MLVKHVLIALSNLSKSVTCIFNTSDLTKCISLNNQPSTTQPTLTNLHPNEYISYKILMGVKLLHIRFDKVNGFIRVYDGNRY